MDRPEVILDIFSTRARSHEAKLQVELAQLEYCCRASPDVDPPVAHPRRHRPPRAGRNPARDRPPHHPPAHPGAQGQAAGRRTAPRESARRSRSRCSSVSLVGYTNAGKSSILRALSGQHEIFVEDRLFATLDTLTREVELGEGQRARVTDTVGFIRKLPHHLVASFRATLEEARAADLLLHVVDASHPDWEGQMRVVERVLAELDLADRPILVVFNKMDAVADPLVLLCARPGALPGCADHVHHADRRDGRAQGAAPGARAARTADGQGAPAGGRRSTRRRALPRRRGARSGGRSRRGRAHGAAGSLAGGSTAGGGAAGGGEWRGEGSARGRRAPSSSRGGDGARGHTTRSWPLYRVDSRGVSLRSLPLSTCSRISHRFMPANFWCILVIGDASWPSSSICRSASASMPLLRNLRRPFSSAMPAVRKLNRVENWRMKPEVGELLVGDQRAGLLGLPEVERGREVEAQHLVRVVLPHALGELLRLVELGVVELRPDHVHAQLRGLPRILDRHLDAARLLIGQGAVDRVGARDDDDVRPRSPRPRP